MKHRKDAVWRNEDGYLVQYNASGRGIQYYWSPTEEQYLREHYPFERSREVAAHIGKPQHCIERKARKMGLEKDREYLRAIHAEQCFKNTYGTHRKGRKGVDYISAYMMAETEEQKNARVAKSVATRNLAVNKCAYRQKCREVYQNLSPEAKAERARKCREARLRAIANGAVEKFKERYRMLSDAEKEMRRKRISISQKKRLAKKRNENEYQAV